MTSVFAVSSVFRASALAADALHFTTDIWSSMVVLVGLLAIKVGEWTGWPGGLG
jgi:divalent metal cation (Fe/Co/Zn/Cd) transporter